MKIDDVELFVPDECKEFIEKYPDDFEVFGCGPGGIGDRLVPDTVWFLSIRNACRIHDWYYRFAKQSSEKARYEADRIFLNNAIRIVETKSKFGWLKHLRKIRCMTYYKAIRLLGGPAYWNDRND